MYFKSINDNDSELYLEANFLFPKRPQPQTTACKH